MMRTLSLLLVLPFTLPAQQASPVTAIRAGTLIDGTGAAPVKNAVILIQGERITAAGATVAIPRGATVIDLSGETVLPGFIDAHVHLAGRTIGDGDWQHSRLTELPSQLALLGAAHAQQTLEAGFTTVRVVGSAHFGDIALRNAINAGWIPTACSPTPWGGGGGTRPAWRRASRTASTRSATPYGTWSNTAPT